MISQKFWFDFIVAAVQAKNPDITDFNEGSPNADIVDVSAKIAAIHSLQFVLIKKGVSIDDSIGFLIDDLIGSFFGESDGRRKTNIFSKGTIKLKKPTGTGNVAIPDDLKLGFEVDEDKFVYEGDVAATFLDAETELLLAITATVASKDFNKAVGTKLTLFQNIPFVETEVEVTIALAGGRKREDDDVYKTRLLEFLSSISTAGPEDGYKFFAKDADSSIVDADIIRRFRAKNSIDIYISTITGQPSPSVLSAVADKLRKKGPATDDQLVRGFVEAWWFITGTVKLKDGVDTATGKTVIETHLADFFSFENSRFRQDLSFGTVGQQIQAAEDSSGFRPAFSSNISLLKRSIYQTKLAETLTTLSLTSLKQVQKFRYDDTTLKKVGLLFKADGGETGTVTIELMTLTEQSLDGQPDTVIDSVVIPVGDITTDIVKFFDFDEIIVPGTYLAIQVSRSATDGNLRMVFIDSDFIAREVLKETPTIVTDATKATFEVVNEIRGFIPGGVLPDFIEVIEITSDGVRLFKNGVVSFDATDNKKIVMPIGSFNAGGSYEINYYTPVEARRSTFDSSYIDGQGTLYFTIMKEAKEDLEVNSAEIATQAPGIFDAIVFT